MNLKFLRDKAPYIFIVSMAFFMFRGIFAVGFMSGTDNSFHYYQAHYLTQTLIPQYHWINGWSMQVLAGFPILVYYCQLGFLFIAFLNKVLFIPLNIAYKMMVFSSYAFLGASFYKLLYQRFGKAASLLAVTCLMLQKNIYYDEILNGMWNYYLGLGLFFIFFRILDENVESMTMKKSLILGLVLGAIILSHLFVGFFAFILLFVYGAWYLVDTIKRNKPPLKQFLYYICIPISACLIAAYYLRNLFAVQNYFDSIYPLSLPAKDIFTGLIWSVKVFLGPLESDINGWPALMINIPVIIRVVFGFFGISIFFKKNADIKTKRFLISVMAFVFIAVIFFSDVLSHFFSWWRYGPFLKNMQTARFLPCIQTGMYVFASYGITEFLRLFRRERFIITCGAVLLLFSTLFHYAYFASDGSRTLEQSPEMSNIYKVWDWINKNISSQEGRVAYQNTLGSIDDPILNRSDVFALSSIFTRAPQASTAPFFENIFMRSKNKAIFGMDIGSMDVKLVSDRMEVFNCKYIVSVEPQLKNKLSRMELFSEENEFGPFTIFKLKGFTSEWMFFKKEGNYEILEFENQRLVFNLWNKSVNNEVTIKVAYYPLWRARLKGKSVEIEQDQYNLMKIFLPDKGNYRLKLLFSSFNYLWASVSLSSLIICIIAIRRSKL